MSKFQIIKSDPLRFKRQILDFWDKYLPGTPHARFEWLSRGNPTGPSVWLFALDSNNELAGMVSIMPKYLVMNGTTVRAGILGDYMIHSKYRVFGPNLLLLKSALTNMPGLNFKLIYTVPNAQSELIIKRVGAENVGSFKNLVKPLDANYYLSKYMNMNPVGRRILAPFINAGLRIVSKETYISSKGLIEESTVIDESFDLLWINVKNRLTMAGDHSSSYLKWKYLQNPLHHFRVLTSRIKTGRSLMGFIIFNIDHSRLTIYTIMALDKASYNDLLIGIVRIGRREKCISISIEIFDTNPLLYMLKSFGFFDAKSDLAVFSSGEIQWPSSDCYLFCGDRNL